MYIIQRDLVDWGSGGSEDYDKMRKTRERKKKLNSLFDDVEKTEVIKKKSIFERIFRR
ncbi:hypothetical protein M0Q50_07470 [bacterium]|jgi:hypothetical protein|nr:hypothetical protein [bacterium]